MKEYKHFNAGNVWGKVKKLKLEESVKGTPYLNLEIDCANETLGKVRTYGRLWGQKKIDQLRQYCDSDPRELLLHFRGMFGQYDNEEKGKRFSNYFFFDWNVATPAINVVRAAFILLGEITELQAVDGEGKIGLFLNRVQEDGQVIDEFFEIWTFEDKTISSLKVGSLLEAKGCLRISEGDSFYGDSGNEIKPYAMKLRMPGV